MEQCTGNNRGSFSLKRFPHRDGVYCLLFGTPLPPVILQNPEKTRFILRLCARSLSLKELHAKSRQHGSYGWQAAVLTVPLELGWSSIAASQPQIKTAVGDSALRKPRPGGQVVKDLILSCR